MEPAHAELLHDRRRLSVVLVITFAYFLIELFGGIYANSLALMTDAVHMLTDIAALILSIVTLWIASRPATAGKTYGYLRAEILGALFNGLFLWMLVAFIWFEAAGRLRNPPHVQAEVMIVIAAVGVIINTASAKIVHRRREGGRVGIALRAVFLHVMADLLGSIGVLIAGVIIYFTRWTAADPAVSLLIGGLIIYGSWGLIREGVDILMESTPAAINLEELRDDLLAVAGTQEVHDLHVWCLASHQFALSAHAVITEETDQDHVLAEMSAVLEHKFKIRHMTVQLERNNRKETEPEDF